MQGKHLLHYICDVAICKGLAGSECQLVKFTDKSLFMPDSPHSCQHPISDGGETKTEWPLVTGMHLTGCLEFPLHGEVGTEVTQGGKEPLQESHCLLKYTQARVT